MPTSADIESSSVREDEQGEPAKIDRNKRRPGGWSWGREWPWWVAVAILWALQCLSVQAGAGPVWGAGAPALLFVPALAAVVATSLRGTARRTGGIPWGRSIAVPGEAEALRQFGHPAVETLNPPPRRRRWLLARCRRESRGPARLAVWNGVLAVVFLVSFRDLTRGTNWGGSLHGPLFFFLVSLSMATWLGNTFEGPLLECLGSRRRLDPKGRLLQGLFHTGVLGTASWLLVLLLFGIIRSFRGGLNVPESVGLAFVLAPPVYQAMRIAAGRIALRWVIRRGALELIPAAEAKTTPLREGDSVAGAFGARARLHGAAWAGAILAALLVSPYWVGLAPSDRPFDAEGMAGTLAVVFIVLEVLAAATTAAAVVLYRSRWQRSAPAEDSLCDLPLRPRVMTLLGLALPWLLVWGAFLPGLLAIPNLVRNPSDFYAIPLILIPLTFPLGLVQGVLLGWSYGLRRRTAPASAAQGLWFQALWTLFLANVSFWGVLAFLYTLDELSLFKLWGLSNVKLGSYLSLFPLFGVPVGTGLHPDLLLVGESIWLGRAFQVLLAVIYHRRVESNRQRMEPTEGRVWGGAVFRWPWLYRRNPIVSRSLGMGPYGGHRRFTLARVGILLCGAALLTVFLSMGIQGTEIRQVPPVWFFVGLGLGIGCPSLSGAWAGLVGVWIARRARESGEDQELHLSLLKGDEIVGGRLAAICGLNFLYALILPLMTLWPFAFLLPHDDFIFIFLLWGLVVFVVSSATCTGDGAVGLWLGSRRRSGVAAGFQAALWGGIMGGATAWGCGFGMLFTIIWLDEVARTRMSEDLGSALTGLIGVGYALVPVLTRLAVGDWLGRRLSSDLVGRDRA